MFLQEWEGVGANAAGEKGAAPEEGLGGFSLACQPDLLLPPPKSLGASSSGCPQHGHQSPGTERGRDVLGGRQVWKIITQIIKKPKHWKITFWWSAALWYRGRYSFTIWDPGMLKVPSGRTKAGNSLLLSVLIEGFCGGPFLAHPGATALSWRAAGNWGFSKASLVVCIAAALAGEEWVCKMRGKVIIHQGLFSPLAVKCTRNAVSWENQFMVLCNK